MSSLPLLVSCHATGDQLDRVALARAPRFQLQIEGASQPLTQLLEEWVAAYLAKKPIPFTLIPPTASPFHTQVWDALLRLPFGQLLSYQELAARVGSPRAARAVGNACGKNQWPLFIPCHRIIPSGSPLRPGGFAFEPAIKSLLIQFEQN